MTFFKIILPFITVLALSTISIGQKANATFEFKKGEVIDFLFLNNKADADSVKNKYFKTAFPVANKYGYTPMGALGVKETPIQGNYHPDAVALGKWPSLEKREEALVQLEKSVDGFHQMRREIWSTFNVAYFVLDEDLTININPDKYYVITNLWKKKTGSGFNKYIKKWASKIKSSKGKHVAQLRDSNAPYGYRYSPDYISITVWESKTAFDKFLKSAKKLDTKSIHHINQFKLN